MRIRSIKPEFWRSDDITAMDITTRLTFIGLWSYVDDNGVGLDKLVSIVADLYADDFSRDPQETVQRVSGDLQRLTSGGQVIRFRAEHNGRAKDLLYITQWKKHQVVNHPSKGAQYPLPPAEMIEAAAALQQVSRESQETLTHEQGNRGTGEVSRGAGEPPNPPRLEPVTDPPAYRSKNGAELVRAKYANMPACSQAAFQIAQAFSASLPAPIESGLLSQVAAQFDKCLRDGISPPYIAAGVKAWVASSSWSPNTIPNFVTKESAKHINSGIGKPTTKAMGYDDAVQQLLEELAS